MRDHQISSRADYEGFEEEPLGYQQYGRAPSSQPRVSSYVRDFEESYKEAPFTLAEEADEFLRLGQMRRGKK